MRVQKRDGRWVEWKRYLIERAIVMAFHDVGATIDKQEIEDLAERVEFNVRELYGEDTSVEAIQDIVEQTLMAKHGSIAKAYILFRNKRAEERSKRLTPDPDALMEYIHPAKYGKLLFEAKRRETFAESVDRVLGMHMNRYAAQIEKSEWLGGEICSAFEFVKERRVLPSMRSMQFGGEPALKRNVRIYNCAFTHANRLRFFAEILWVLLCGSGAGFSVQHHHVEQLPEVKYIDPNKVSYFIVEDSCMGWAEAVNHLIRCYFITGELPEFSYHLIRLQGSPLSSGGKAPGHLGLKVALEAMKEILDAAQGRKLAPIEVFDMVCHEAEAVLSGGIRRSSLICLFSADDSEMMVAKARGNYRPVGHKKGVKNDQRGMANISAVLERDKTEWQQFKRIVEMSRAWGCPGFYFTHDLEFGCNPCGEIGMMPKLTRGIHTEDKSIDFDWRKYRVLQEEQRANGYPDRPADSIRGITDWAISLYGNNTGWQFCNLVEINAALCKDEEEFWEACRHATTIATLQAGYADFWYLGPVTEEVARREALIGVGITGMQDNPEIALDPHVQRQGAKIVIRQNERVAKECGIKKAARCTTVKPSGTASLELGCVGSGIHPHHARRYFRRVTANRDEGPFLHFKKFNPHMCEEKPNGDWCITFPVQAPANAGTVKQTAAHEFMEQVFSTYENWIEPGTRPESESLNHGLRHNVSCTVTYDKAEWEDTIEYAWLNRHRVTAMTFLENFSDKAFPFAPREEVKTAQDEAKWRELIALYRPVDWSQANEDDDNVPLAAACEGPLCEIP